MRFPDSLFLCLHDVIRSHPSTDRLFSELDAQLDRFAKDNKDRLLKRRYQSSKNAQGRVRIQRNASSFNITVCNQRPFVTYICTRAVMLNIFGNCPS